MIACGDWVLIKLKEETTDSGLVIANFRVKERIAALFTKKVAPFTSISAMLLMWRNMF